MITNLLEELVAIGFNTEEAQKLDESDYFHHKKKNRYELTNLLNQISQVYLCTFDEIKKAIFTHPQFAGLDHQRVVRQKTRLGRMAGLSTEETIDYLLDNPVLAAYSAKRYLAAFDIGRKLEKEGFSQNQNMLEIFFSHFFKSPYVPDSERKRISQYSNNKEPPLLTAMRKNLLKNSL